MHLVKVSALVTTGNLTSDFYWHFMYRTRKLVWFSRIR